MFPAASSRQGGRNASYTSGASRGASRRSRFVLEKRDDGTLVRLREFGFRKLENLIDNAGGWGEALTLAKFWVEHGIATNQLKERV